jgi:hypothetical protein
MDIRRFRKKELLVVMFYFLFLFTLTFTSHSPKRYIKVSLLLSFLFLLYYMALFIKPLFLIKAAPALILHLKVPYKKRFKEVNQFIYFTKYCTNISFKVINTVSKAHIIEGGKPLPPQLYVLYTPKRVTKAIAVNKNTMTLFD